MQKNWYMLYVRKDSEKRVSKTLKKKNIASICPINCRQIRRFGKVLPCYEPLFGSYVFANLSDSDFPLIKKIQNIVNLVHWKDKPVIITYEEIQIIKEFTSLYQNITIKKYQPHNDDDAKNNAGVLSYCTDGKIFIVKNNSTKVLLPSLGLAMIAETERSKIVERKPSIIQRDLSQKKGERAQNFHV